MHIYPNFKTCIAYKLIKFYFDHFEFSFMHACARLGNSNETG